MIDFFRRNRFLPALLAGLALVTSSVSAGDFYTASGAPAARAPLSSATMRAEFALIEDGFDKLPTLTGNALEIVRVNAGATALESTNLIDNIVIGSVTPAAGSFAALSASGATTLAGTVRILGATQGLLGVLDGAASGQTPNSGVDSIVIDANGNAGLSILGPNTSTQQIIFGDTESNGVGGISYLHASDTLRLAANGVKLSLVGSAATFASGVTVTADALRLGSAAAYGTLSVREAGAYGGAGPNTSVDGIVLEANTSTGISILTPNTGTGQVRFGDPENAASGGINYVHSSNELRLVAGDPGVNVLTAVSTGVTIPGTLAVSGAITGNVTGNVTGNITGDVTVDTSGGNVLASTYTPTLTNGTNVASSTARLATYMRVGNTVTVGGQLDVDPTATGATVLGISLPVASDFTTVYQAGGTGVSNSLFGADPAAIAAHVSGNRAEMSFVATFTNSRTITYTFTYQVL